MLRSRRFLALVLVTGLYVAFGRRAGRFGLVAYLLNAFALAALVGVEFVINLVFVELRTDTIDFLRAGPLRVALTVEFILFLVGNLAFAVAIIRTRRDPHHALGPVRRRCCSGVPPSFRA